MLVKVRWVGGGFVRVKRSCEERWANIRGLCLSIMFSMIFFIIITPLTYEKWEYAPKKRGGLRNEHHDDD